MTDTAALCPMPHRKPAEPAAGLLVCPDHHAQIRETLTDIVEFYATIPFADVDRPHAQDAGERHTKKPHSPALTNLDILAYLDPRTGPMTDPHGEHTLTMLYGPEIPNVPDELAVYTDTIADLRSMTRPGPTVTEKATFLHRHHDWICADPMIVDYDRHLRLIRSKLMTLLRLPKPRLVGHCFAIEHSTECGAPLFLPPGGREVECRRCHRVYSGPDLLRLKVIGAHEDIA